MFNQFRYLITILQSISCKWSPVEDLTIHGYLHTSLSDLSHSSQPLPSPNFTLVGNYARMHAMPTGVQNFPGELLKSLFLCLFRFGPSSARKKFPFSIQLCNFQLKLEIVVSYRTKPISPQPGPRRFIPIPYSHQQSGHNGKNIFGQESKIKESEWLKYQIILVSIYLGGGGRIREK